MDEEVKSSDENSIDPNLQKTKVIEKETGFLKVEGSKSSNSTVKKNNLQQNVEEIKDKCPTCTGSNTSIIQNERKINSQELDVVDSAESSAVIQNKEQESKGDNTGILNIFFLKQFFI